MIVKNIRFHGNLINMEKIANLSNFIFKLLLCHKFDVNFFNNERKGQGSSILKEFELLILQYVIHLYKP